MNDLVIYVHGKGGNAAESGHYGSLFPGCNVVGLDYHDGMPDETGAEIRKAVTALSGGHGNIILIANSIGAFYCMNAGIGDRIQSAFFISPIVNMERLILDMLTWAHVTEEELKEKGVIHTDFGEDLSWAYLTYVRDHPAEWNVPTRILYGSRDHLTSFGTMKNFADSHGASLTVMEDGEHWFHTEEQMRFLDDWILKSL